MSEQISSDTLDANRNDGALICMCRNTQPSHVFSTRAALASKSEFHEAVGGQGPTRDRPRG